MPLLLTIRNRNLNKRFSFLKTTTLRLFYVFFFNYNSRKGVMAKGPRLHYQLVKKSPTLWQFELSFFCWYLYLVHYVLEVKVNRNKKYFKMHPFSDWDTTSNFCFEKIKTKNKMACKPKIVSLKKWQPII